VVAISVETACVTTGSDILELGGKTLNAGRHVYW